MFVWRLSKQVSKRLQRPAYSVSRYVKFFVTFFLVSFSLNAYSIFFPAGDFNSSTNVGGFYDTTSFGFQGGAQTTTRYVVNTNLISLTLGGMDYNDTTANASWMVILGVSADINFFTTILRGGRTAITIAPSGGGTYIFTLVGNGVYGLITNNTASFPAISVGSEFSNSSMTLKDSARIYSFNSIPTNPVINSDGPFSLDLVNTILTPRDSIIGTITSKGGTITLGNADNINGNITSTTGGTLNVLFNSTGRVTGSITTETGTLTVGPSVNYTPDAGGIFGFDNFIVSNLGIFNTNASISSIDGTVSVVSGGTLNVNNIMSGSAVVNNSGTINNNVANGMALTGLFTNSSGATFNIQQNLSRSKPTTNTGSIVLTSGKTFTHSGNSSNKLIFNAGGTMSGAGIFTNTGVFDYNNSSSSNGLTFTGLFTNSGTSNIKQNLTRSGPTTNTGSIVLTSGKTFTHSGTGSNAFILNSGGTISGSGGIFTNTGLFDFNGTNSSALSFTGLLTNSGTFRVDNNLIRTSSTTNSGGTFAINTGKTFTNSGSTFTFSGGTISGAGTFVNTGTTNVTDNLTISSLSTNTGAIRITSGKTFTNSGTMTNNTTGTIIDNGASGSFTNSGIFNFNGTNVNALSFTGLFTNSGTSNIKQNLTRSGPTTNTSSIVLTSGKTFTHSGNSSNKLIFNAGGTMSGSGGIFTNTGVFDYNNSSSSNGLTFTGLFTNSGTLNVQQDLTRANLTTNSGTISIVTPRTFTNTGTLTSTGTIDGTGIFKNSGTLNVNGGIISVSTFNVDTNGIVNINNSPSITTPMIGTGASNATVLNIGPVVNPTVFTTGAAITDIRTINIFNGSSLNAGDAITGVNTLFNVGSSVNSASTATFTAAVSGSGVINNYGTMNFNTGSSLATFPTINANTNSSLNFNTDLILTDTNIIGANSNSGTSLTIDNNSKLQTNALIDDIKNITIALGSTLKLNFGASVTGNNSGGGRTINLAGTLEIDERAEFIIDTADVINGAVSGNILNSGNLITNYSSITLGGTFNNTVTGIFQINGVPTLNFNGAFTNVGAIMATFNTENSLPVINTLATPTLVDGVLMISYQNNYIAGGDYPFIVGPAGTIPVGGFFLPPPSTYISSWALTSAPSGTISVTVNRIGFGEVATNPIAKLIGDYLEFLGSNPPVNQTILDLLNALEKITDPNELNAALLQIVPPAYVPLQSLNMIQNVLTAVQGRIANVRTGFSAGELDHNNSIWIRPFVSSGRQEQSGNLLGYNAKVNGFAFGLDNLVSNNLMFGAAGSISKSKVTDKINESSRTDISSYQAMIYGTLRSKTDAYLDWILATGINNYHAERNINITTFNATAYSDYSGQQFTIKSIASKNYVWNKYYQLTPLASAQYSYLHQSNYAETGAGDLSRTVNQNNINLLELGVGGKIAVPFSYNTITSIPEAHIMFLVDSGGAQDTNSQFISGGPILNNSVRSGKFMIRIGASFTFAISDRLQLIANYDFETRNKYMSNEAYLNFKFTF